MALFPTLRSLLAGGLIAVAGAAGAYAADASAENVYYKMTPIPLPKDEVLEIGAMEFLPDGPLALSTRRGEIWTVTNPLDEAWAQKWHRYASGLHEVLGLSFKDGTFLATQRGELTKLRDEDGDGEADSFQTVNDDWNINGDYHEYAFGSKPDKDGNVWVVLCLTGSFSSESKYRGWCLRVTPDGKAIPTCSGLRSPGGIAANAAGDMFYTDNQGPWNGTCSLKHLAVGKFMGHPGGNKWYKETTAIGDQPKDPQSGSRFMTEAAKIPEYEPPVILFPYQKMGQSAAGIACDQTGGKFGPFGGQLFVADQTHSTVMRCYLEQVDGHYQGACFPFRSGFGSGSLAVEFAPDGSLFVGGTNRGWGSRGPKPFALDRLEWTGKVPFEIAEMKARSDGFELVFTEPVDPATAADLKSYKLSTYTFIYQADYGSPEVDHTDPKITAATVSEDGRRVTLTVEGLQAGHVHELHADGVRSKESQPLLHAEAYYTLNRIPK